MQNRMICYCSNVSEKEVRDSIENGAKSMKDIREATRACTVGKCREMSPKGK